MRKHLAGRGPYRQCDAIMRDHIYGTANAKRGSQAFTKSAREEGARQPSSVARMGTGSQSPGGTCGHSCCVRRRRTFRSDSLHRTLFACCSKHIQNQQVRQRIACETCSISMSRTKPAGCVRNQPASEKSDRVQSLEDWRRPIWRRCCRPQDPFWIPFPNSQVRDLDLWPRISQTVTVLSHSQCINTQLCFSACQSCPVMLHTAS